MSRKITLIGLLALMLSVPAMAADFSGSYNLQRGDAHLVVQQVGDSLTFTHTRVDRAGQQRVTTFTYVVNGESRSVADLRGGSRNVTAQWKDDSTLLVQSDDGRRTATETWTLAGDTLTLKIAPNNSARPNLGARTIVFQR